VTRTERYNEQARTAFKVQQQLEALLEAYLVKRFGRENVQRVHDSIIVEVDRRGVAR